MAAKSKSMHQVRQILELHIRGKSHREIVKLTGFAKNTVRAYITRAKSVSEDLALVLSHNDEALRTLILSPSSHSILEDERYQYLSSRTAYYLEELNRVGVTKQLLWTEYRGSQPNGYGYTQFCKYICDEQKKRGVVANFSHTPGEEMQIDFAGDKMYFIDVTTGEKKACEILVCALPYSHLVFATALPSQKQESFIEGICKALEYFGGVPLSLKSDNLKSAVIKANRYEPTFTEAMVFLGEHYNTNISATRIYKPRDKASVEKAVDLIYKHIFAPLRDHQFHSIEELNIAIYSLLEVFNSRIMQQKNISRIDLFNRDEKATLRPLPIEKYQIKHSVYAKVQKNYHIILGEDRKQYSVPYSNVGKRVKVVYTFNTVEIYDGNSRIATHHRDYSGKLYVTNGMHMPENHQAVHTHKAWDKEDFISQANAIGEHTYQAILKLFDNYCFIEQSYDACLGVLRLKYKYSPERLEMACKRALRGKYISYKAIHNILNNNQDKLELELESDNHISIPDHPQIRGASFYQ